MSVIAPCITAETREQFDQTVEHIKPFASRVHLDISDGVFTPNTLVGATHDFALPKEWKVDIHAMVAAPDAYVESLIMLEPELIIFHAEVTTDLVPILQRIKQSGIKAGVSLVRTTVPKAVQQYIIEADHIMIFSGDLGRYGGTANMMQLEKVRLIKAINQSVEIGWDGGVNAENAYTLAQGGVDVLNAGGYISQAPDAQVAYSTLMNEISKQGVI